MSAALAQESRAEDGVIGALPGRLRSLATIVVASFDRVLAGMVRAGQGIEALCCFLGLTRALLDHHLARLGLPTPHDRPPRRPGSRGWSEADTRRLIAWRVAGVHPEIIGQRLERPRSASAVRAKARRLGLEAPPRKLLHRPPPEALRDPAPGLLFAIDTSAQPPSPVGMCGRAAGEVSVAGAANGPVAAVHPLVERAEKDGVAAASAPRRSRKARPDGQRELQLFGVVGGTAIVPDADSALVPVIEAPPVDPEPRIPRHEDEVDLSGDLTWFGRIKRLPLANRAAVWIAFMLIAGGASYKSAAKRLGVTPGMFRTFRQRARVPVDYDRKKAGDVFDPDTARVTLERSGFVLRQAVASEDVPKDRVPWFWVRRSEAARIRLSPTKRPRERVPGEPRSDTFVIFTRAMLDAERRVPFAGARGRVFA